MSTNMKKKKIYLKRVYMLDSHLTDAVRERCSLESMTQPTWHSNGGFELCRVFLFLGV